MRRRLLPVFLALGLAVVGCADSDDPAEGGFFNGVAGIAGGGYDARITEREQALAAAQGQHAALTAELAGLESQYAALQQRIRAQQAALTAKGVHLPAETEARIEHTVASTPDQADPAARAASLRQAIADARRLSEQLAALAS